MLGLKLIHASKRGPWVLIESFMFGSYYDLVANREQAIIWTNIESLLIEDLRTNFNEIWNQIQPFWKSKSIKYFRLQNGGHFVRSVKF